MSQSDSTRREFLLGMAAVPLPPDALQAEAAAFSLCFMSTVEIARLIRTKKLSAREALAMHLKQIERVNPKVNAIVTLIPEMAAADAAKADEMQARKQTTAWSSGRAQGPDGNPWYPHNLWIAAV